MKLLFRWSLTRVYDVEFFFENKSMNQNVYQLLWLFFCSACSENHHKVMLFLSRFGEAWSWVVTFRTQTPVPGNCMKKTGVFVCKTQSLYKIHSYFFSFIKAKICCTLAVSTGCDGPKGTTFTINVNPNLLFLHND